jgi:hypothetical protein
LAPAEGVTVAVTAVTLFPAVIVAKGAPPQLVANSTVPRISMLEAKVAVKVTVDPTQTIPALEVKEVGAAL